MMGEVIAGSTSDRSGRLVGVAVTVFAHLGFLALVIFARGGDPFQEPPQREYVEARLVEIPIKAGSDKGTVEDPSKVEKGPEISPPPPEEPPDSPEPVPRQKEPPPQTTPKVDPETRIETLAAIEKLAEDEMDKVGDLPKKGKLGTGDQSIEDGEAKGAGGDKDKGITDPCALTFKSDLRGYRSKIQAMVGGFKRPSFISADLAENLVTGVRVTFDGTGNIVSVATSSSSGNPMFDKAAEDFVRSLGKLEAPPRCVMFDMNTGVFTQTRSFLVRLKGN